MSPCFVITLALLARANPIEYSRAKHSAIRTSFVRDYIQKGDISIKRYLSSIYDIFTKHVNED